MRLQVVAALTLAALTSPAMSAQEVRDSAGGRLVRYGSAARPSGRWVMDTVPQFAVGGTQGTGPAELARVIAVVRLSNGRVAVATRASNELRYFAPDGRHVATVGRRGQGPGEFDQMVEVHRSADTLAVTDRSGRLQFFSPAGELLRGYTRASYPGASVFGWAGTLPGGVSLLRALDPPTDTTGEEVTATMSFVARPAASDSLRWVARFPYVRTRRMSGAVSAGQRGFSPLWLGGMLKAVVTGTRLCAGDLDVWAVTCLSADGQLIWRTSRAVPRRPVGDRGRRRFEQVFRENVGKGMPPAQLEATLRTFAFAEYQAPIGRVVPGAAGEVWVAEFRIEDEVPRGDGEFPSPGTASRWSVLGSDGRWLADVSLPARFALMDAGRDYVAGVRRDEDDVEQVVVYRLRR